MRAIMAIMAVLSVGGLVNGWLLPATTVVHQAIGTVVAAVSFLALVVSLAAYGIMGHLRELELYQNHIAGRMDQVVGSGALDKSSAAPLTRRGE